MASVDVDDAGSLSHRSLLALVWTCFSIASFFVALRTVIRFKVAHRLTVEDFWIFLALTALLTLCILDTVQLPSLYYVTAVLAGDIPMSPDLISHTEDYLKFEFPIIILFWTTIWCVKAAFLALYFKLFREFPLYRRVWYILATFTFLAYVGCVISLSLSCGNISNFFKFAGCATASSIWASNFAVYYSTTVDIFTDLCIMAMPLRLIYNVKITLRQKAGLVCVIGLSFVMIAFAIIRAKQILVQQYFVNLTLLMIWSMLAASIAVVVGSLPAFRLLVTNRASTKSSRYSSTDGGSKQRVSSNTDLGSKSIPLSLLSSRKKLPTEQHRDASDSREKIIQSDGAQFALVEDDIETVSYREMDRPCPVYLNRQPPSGYGRAI